MEQQTEEIGMLDLMPHPTFCIENGAVTRLNQAARKLFLREGLPIQTLLESGNEDYAAFSGGMLYLTLIIHDQRFGASVVRIGREDVFTLDQQFESEQLRVLALAARELRGPLAGAMLAAQHMARDAVTGQLNRSLCQLLRIVGNMSDAAGFGPMFRPEHVNVGALFQEIGEKAITLSEQTGVQISFTGLEKSAVCCLDRQMMERAVLNMISNALKFTPKGGNIQLALYRNGKQFRFSVSDSGGGITEQEQATLFTRYLREPTVEDPRHGIGLGMLLIRNAAARHRGAVLVDRPHGGGSRVTITFFSAPVDSAALHSKLVTADYGGEQDHALIELSDFLPYSAYE